MSCKKENLRDAISSDLRTCTEIRGKTRDNPLSEEVLISIGVTEEKWSAYMEEGKIIGSVYECDGQVVGFCFADTESSEILVLALLPEFENKGIGKMLLQELIRKMIKLGHEKLWLAASPDPAIRAHGFYRHLGWVSTGKLDSNQDEILEYVNK